MRESELQLDENGFIDKVNLIRKRKKTKKRQILRQYVKVKNTNDE